MSTVVVIVIVVVVVVIRVCLEIVNMKLDKDIVLRLQRNDATLTTLDLSYGRRRGSLGSDDISMIATVLRSNTVLNSLLLCNNHIGDKNIIVIINAIMKVNHTCALQRLGFSDNGITERGAQYIACLLRINTKLQVLDVRNNQIGPKGTLSISESIQQNHPNTVLKELLLDCNNIGNGGAMAIATMLRHNTSLVSVSLRRNNIGSVGCLAIALALQPSQQKDDPNPAAKHCTTTIHRNSSNRIYYVQTYPKCTTTNNNNSLKAIDLAFNNIGDQECVLALSDMIQSNTSLTNISLAGNVNIGFQGIQTFAIALQYNTTLKGIDLSSIINMDTSTTTIDNNSNSPNDYNVILNSIYYWNDTITQLNLTSMDATTNDDIETTRQLLALKHIINQNRCGTRIAPYKAELGRRTIYRWLCESWASW